MSYILKQIKALAARADLSERFLTNAQEHQSIIASLPAVIENTQTAFYANLSTNRQGEYLFTDGLGRFRVIPMVNFTIMCMSASEVTEAKRYPVGMSTIFNSWYRFSHGADGQNLSTTAHVQGREKWSYNASTNAIYTNLNSSVYMGFISPNKYSNYYLKVRLDGDDNDNDMIGIVLAFVTDNTGVEHTLSLVRCKKIEGHTVYRYALVYDYKLPTEYKLADKQDYILDVEGGWKNEFVLIEALRVNDTLTLATSQISVNAIDQNTTITYTLPKTQPPEMDIDTYQNLKLMLGSASQLGFSAYSETGHFTVLEQKYIFNDTKVYDYLNNIVWEYKASTATWANIGKVTATLTDGLYYNTSTARLIYYQDQTALTVKLP